MELLPLNTLSREFMTLSRPGEKGYGLSKDQTPLTLQTSSVGKDIDIKKDELRKAAEGFEAIFIRQMLQTMRTGLDESMFGDGPAGGIYSDIADQAVSQAMAKRGTLGIVDNLYNTMVRRIEMSDASETSVTELKLF